MSIKCQSNIKEKSMVDKVEVKHRNTQTCTLIFPDIIYNPRLCFNEKAKVQMKSQRHKERKVHLWEWLINYICLVYFSITLHLI